MTTCRVFECQSWWYIQWPWDAKIPGDSLLWCQTFVDPQYGTFIMSPLGCQEFLRCHLCCWQMSAHVQLSQNC